MMAANKPPQYNPMMMQLAQQMMQAGQQRPMTYGRTDGLAAGLTSAGNSLVGALMMKKQMKAQNDAMDEFLDRLGINRDEAGNILDKDGNVVDDQTIPVEGIPMAAKSSRGRNIAAAMLAPFGMDQLVRKRGAVPSAAAGAPSGRKAAPAAQSTSVFAGMDPRAKEMISAMLSNSNPEFQRMGMQALVQNMPQPMKASDRYKVVGNQIFDVAKQQYMTPPPLIQGSITVKPGENVHVWTPEGYVTLTNPKETEWELKAVGDEALTNEWETPTKVWAWVNPKTREVVKTPFIAEMAALGREERWSKTTMNDLQKKIIAGREQLALFDEIEGLLSNDDFLRNPKKIQMWWAQSRDKWGWPLSDETKESLEKFSEFRSAAFEAINLYIKNITGAQMSQAEAARLTKAMPDPESDSPTTYRAKLRRVRKSCEAAVQRYDEAIANGATHDEAQIQASAASRSAYFDDEISDPEGKPSDVWPPPGAKIVNGELVWPEE